MSLLYEGLSGILWTVAKYSRKISALAWSVVAVGRSLKVSGGILDDVFFFTPRILFEVFQNSDGSAVSVSCLHLFSCSCLYLEAISSDISLFRRLIWVLMDAALVRL